jgi:hypothetical protein
MSSMLSSYDCGEFPKYLSSMIYDKTGISVEALGEMGSLELTPDSSMNAFSSKVLIS